MSGGAGAIMDMIARIRDNSNLLKKPRYFRKYKKDLHIHTNIPYLDTKPTPEQLEEIRQELAKQKQKNKKTSIWVFILSVVLTGIVVKFLIIDILLSYFTK